MFGIGKNKDQSLTGIVAGRDGTVVACVERHGDEDIHLRSCNFTPASGKSDNVFADLDDRALGKRSCTTLLPVGSYQLLVVDAPDVPPEEMRAAIRWRIQDQIDFHIDDAVIDIFDAPPAGPAHSNQVYVVVTHRDTVKQRIDDLEAAGVQLDVIDIPELAMRNIAARLPEDEAGLVSLYFDENRCLITITHNAELFLTRSIDVGYLQLQEDAASPQGLCNRIALEIQRSMDYYEHNYHQAAVRAIAILPVPVTLFGLEDALQQTLGLSTRSVTVGDLIPDVSAPDPAVAADCLLALGSALRTEEVAL